MSRVPPHNLDAERAIVGAALLGGRDTFRLAAPIAAPSDLYHPTLSAVWQACADLDALGEPIDTLTVTARLSRSDEGGRMLAAQGPAFLAELVAGVLTVANVAHYARLVADAARGRRLLEALQAATAALYDGTHADEVTAAAEAALVASRPRLTGGRRLALIAREGIARIEARFEGGETDTIPTGLRDLDLRLGGGLPKGLSVVAARPSMGKTAFAWGRVRHAASVGAACLFLSREMRRADLWERDVVAEARVPAGALRSGRLAPPEWVRLHNATRDLVTSDPNIVVDDTPRTIDDVISSARLWRLRDGKGPRAEIVLDYLQLVGPSRSLPKSSTREREVAYTSAALKDVSQELDAVVVALSQLNRDCERRPDKRPILADLRDSGSIEQDGDVILGLYRDCVYNPEADRTAGEVLILKQRNGPTGCSRASYFGPSTTWADADGQPEPPPQRDPKRRTYQAHPFAPHEEDA